MPSVRNHALFVFLCSCVSVLVSCSAPRPLTLFSSDLALSKVLVAPNAVYVKQTSPGSPAVFLRVPKDGESVEVIRPSENLGAGPVTDGTDLYWFDFHKNVCTKPIESTSNVVASCSGPGATEKTNPAAGYTLLTQKEFRDLLEGKDFEPFVREVITDATQLYWVFAYPEPNDWLLMSGPRRGGERIPLARGQFLSEIAVDSDTIFWRISGEIYALRKNGAGSAKVLYKDDAEGNLVSDGSFLYFATRRSVKKVRKSDGSVSSLDDRGGLDEKQVPSALAIDQSNVYVAFSQQEELLGNYRGDSVVFKIPREAGKRIKLASCPGRISELVVNAGQLYWVSCQGTNGPCQVMAAATH